MWIDTHGHLDPKDFLNKEGKDERGDVLARARAAGVHQMIVIGSGEGWDDIEPALAFANADPHLYAAIGVHPTHAHVLHPSTKDHDTLWKRIEQTAHTNPRVVAIGETGLDTYQKDASLPQQQAVFERLLHLAQQTKKPLSLHIRDTHAEAIKQVQRFPGSQGVVHCFTGTVEEAQQWVDLGFYISFSGIVTFPKATQVQHACAWVPSDRLLLETDCPYLAPVPVRGKRNEPAYLVHTGTFVAALRGVSTGDLAACTSNNAKKLFRLPPIADEKSNRVHQDS